MADSAAKQMHTTYCHVPLLCWQLQATHGCLGGPWTTSFHLVRIPLLLLGPPTLSAPNEAKRRPSACAYPLGAPEGGGTTFLSSPGALACPCRCRSAARGSNVRRHNKGHATAASPETRALWANLLIGTCWTARPMTAPTAHRHASVS
eukprot:366400-Chlamydomonas_euryale.AAC.23